VKIEQLLRRVIREEIGRNYHSIDTGPGYSYEDYPGINIELYPANRGETYQVQVTCEFDDSLSTPKRTFRTEEDAQTFAREHAEIANRARLGRNIEV
jgi:hypothetical protein